MFVEEALKENQTLAENAAGQAVTPREALLQKLIAAGQQYLEGEITVEEAAALLGKHPGTIRRAVRKGALPDDRSKPRGRMRVRRGDLELLAGPRTKGYDPIADAHGIPQRPAGNLMRSVYMHGKEDRRTLGHRDKNKSVTDGYPLLAQLQADADALNRGTLTLGALIERYKRSPAFAEKKGYEQVVPISLAGREAPIEARRKQKAIGTRWVFSSDWDPALSIKRELYDQRLRRLYKRARLRSRKSLARTPEETIMQVVLNPTMRLAVAK